ncbi:uncharacterized protein KY384_007564 [Bacidia gigantensis]|uniref:uncharacterized protein n=1 Tax=Bacidia gigantensis TaxID=2732470 RepID=UPI001D05858A|nr:uncharacterized protein KY384_007564 [Bacidia gigantensis]KAG8527412.1 hypothetical protein KY384_007564 [Bacidia gigantensis]
MSSQVYGVFVLLLLLIFALITLRTAPWPNPDHSRSFPTASSISTANTAVDGPNAISTNDNPQFELVISHYQADFKLIQAWTEQIRSTPYVSQLGMKLVIYTKNANVNLDILKSATGADVVQHLPNLGREGATILHHLITTYASPSPFSMFSQDEPEWSIDTDTGLLEPFLIDHLTHSFRPNTGFLALNKWNEPCYCGNCGGRGQFPLQVAIYNMFERGVCHEMSWVTLWSQFIVSAQRVRERDLRAYKWLFKMMTAPKDHWIHEETQPDFIKEEYMEGESTPDNPLFGHTLERSWNMIFNCAFPNDIEESMRMLDEHRVHCVDWKMEGQEKWMTVDGKSDKEAQDNTQLEERTDGDGTTTRQHKQVQAIGAPAAEGLHRHAIPQHSLEAEPSKTAAQKKSNKPSPETTQDDHDIPLPHNFQLEEKQSTRKPPAHATKSLIE